MTDEFCCFHFSQANPAGTGQSSVPALLRRVADSIEALGQIDVQDITFAMENTADGIWPSLTVYYVNNQLESRCSSDPAASWTYDRSAWTPLLWGCVIEHPDDSRERIGAFSM